MRIGLVASEFHNPNSGKTGGLGTYLWKISQVLATSGHDIFLISLGKENNEINISENITSLIIKSSDYKPNSIDLNLNKFSVKLLKFSYIQKLRLNHNARTFSDGILSLNKRFLFDIIQYPNLGGLFYFHPPSIPYVVRLSGLASVSFHSGEGLYGIPIEKANATIKWENQSLKKAKAIYSPSLAMLKHVENYQDKLTEVIETPYFDYDIAESLFKPPKSPFLLFFGSIDQRKGCDLLIDAINILSNSNPDINCVFAGRFIGTSSIDIEIKRRILSENDNFTYVGELNKSDLFNLIKASKFVVLPSRSDNFPNTLIESLQLGKPVIGPNNWGFEQMIINGENGYLFSSENLLELVNCIEKLWKASEMEIAAMGKKSKLSIQKLDAQVIAKQLIRFYKKVLNKVS